VPGKQAAYRMYDCMLTSRVVVDFPFVSITQWLADEQVIDQPFPTTDAVPGDWEKAKFVDLEVKDNMLIPSIADWPTRPISWWRAQMTR
jgi:hypothetical protein